MKLLAAILLTAGLAADVRPPVAALAENAATDTAPSPLSTGGAIGSQAQRTLAASTPRPAPSQYVSTDYTLVFNPPDGSTYCPLPEDWIGSNHGTTLFLAPPTECGGSGYASSSRGWWGAPSTPRLSVSFSFNTAPEFHEEPECDAAGRLDLVGRNVRLCRVVHTDRIELSAHAHYRQTAEIDVLLDLRLVTTPERASRDERVMRVMAASVRTCRNSARAGGRVAHWGEGAPCPPDQYF